MGSSGKAAEPPEAVSGQGQGEVDRGLGRLEAPVAAGRLVDDGLPDAATPDVSSSWNWIINLLFH
jgi:hypothetical protein